MSTTAPDPATTVTGGKYAGRPMSDDPRSDGPTSDDVAASVPVLAAVWCRSVGTSWTLELHELGPGMAPRKIMRWISSGVPISQPEPETLARALLTERGLQLFCDSSAGPGTRSRPGIGYVSGDAELIKLAHVVREFATGAGVHPVVLAAQWVAAGFSADAAARWLRMGVRSPQEAVSPAVSPTHTIRGPRSVV